MSEINIFLKQIFLNDTKSALINHNSIRQWQLLKVFHKCQSLCNSFHSWNKCTCLYVTLPTLEQLNKIWQIYTLSSRTTWILWELCKQFTLSMLDFYNFCCCCKSPLLSKHFSLCSQIFQALKKIFWIISTPIFLFT